MKRAIIFIIAISMICVSISSAGFSQKVGVNISNSELNKTISDNNHLTTEQTTYYLEKTVDKYLSTSMDNFVPYEATDAAVELPWLTWSNSDLLEWWVTIEYDGQTFSKQVDVSIDDFNEKFLKHPEYAEILYFNVDDDPADDIQVRIGFYWSVIKYPNLGDNARSLEFRFRVRQMSGESVEDQTAEFKVWSQLRVNYGLINNPPNKSVSVPRSIKNINSNNIISKIFEKFNEAPNAPFFARLKDIINNFFNFFIKYNAPNIVTLDNSEADYIAIGSGYCSDEGERIPLDVEKRFAFAKGFNLNWRDEGNLFNPTIFQQELYDVSSPDAVELLYGFQAYEGATNTKKFDIAFSTEFNPPVYLRTKYIPEDGYVYYYFDSKSRRQSTTEVRFTADVYLGSAVSVPTLVLEFDEIDETIGSTNRWFSFDILGKNGFKYEASDRFDIGIKVDVPFGENRFEEKVKISGLPKSVECTWGVDDWSFSIKPTSFSASLDLFTQVKMSESIGKLIVYYPKTNIDDPDSPFLEVTSIPSSQRVSTGGEISLSKSGNIIDIGASGHAGITMSADVGDLTLYYPKSDWVNDPDMKFMAIPQGIPSSMSASAGGQLHVDTSNIMSTSNYISGSVDHTMSSNFHEFDIYIPLGFDLDAVEPIVKFTEIPAQTNSMGKLRWGALEGEFHSTRGAVGGFDPIDINLDYGDFSLMNHLEITEGNFDTSFQVATNGHFYLDTDQGLHLADEIRFEDKKNNNKLVLSIDQISADNLYANWDLNGSGTDLKINSLRFDGILDTLKGLHFDLEYQGKSTWLELDWITGQQGYIEIDFRQDEPIYLDFDLSETLEGFDFYGDIELPSNPHFDMQWKWHQGAVPTDPGYFRINENSNEVSFNDFNFYLNYLDTWGVEAQASNLGFYVNIEWYWWNLMLYIWPVIDISGDIDVNLLLNGQWYYNVEDWVNPP